MSQSIQTLAIGETTVRQHNGLFCLNDLHKASGSNPSHRPGEFLRNDQTKALVAEIETAGISAVSTREGRNGGTFASRELVIAYAAWVNAAFHLKVIRVFLAATAPQAGPAITYDRISPAQAQDLKEIVAAIVAAKVQTYGETWARLQKKFRVNSYLELPATQHLQARAYLLAKLPQPSSPAARPPALQAMIDQWMAIVNDEVAPPAPAPSAAPEHGAHIHSAFAAAAQAGAQVQAQVFSAILNQQRSGGPQRLLVSFGQHMVGGQGAVVQAIAQEARLIDLPTFIGDIAEGECPISTTDLLALAHACNSRAHSRLRGYAKVITL